LDIVSSCRIANDEIVHWLENVDPLPDHSLQQRPSARF
jgi:hypothetical protein